MKADPFQALVLALGLMTRLPVSRWLKPELDGPTQGLAVAFYPLVGVGLGVLLWGAQSALGEAAPMLTAFVVLALWVGLTGALHLDGLADSVDGYFAGHKDQSVTDRRDRILAVMREPACGAMAVAALILLLLGKWVALTVLIQSSALGLVSWVLVLGLARLVLLPYVLTSDYARAQGMATVLKTHLPEKVLLGVMLASVLVAILLWPLGLALPVLLVLGLLTVCWRALWQGAIGGFTGDCLGALVELSELAVLLVLAFMLV